MPALADDQIAPRTLADGDVLFEVGQASYDFALILEGVIDIVGREGTARRSRS